MKVKQPLDILYNAPVGMGLRKIHSLEMNYTLTKNFRRESVMVLEKGVH